MTDLVFGWAPGDYIHRKCIDCNPDGSKTKDLFLDGWFGDKHAYRCKPCAERMAWVNNMITEFPDDQIVGIPEDFERATPSPITVKELIQRGMDDRLAQIINTLVGDYLRPPEWLAMTDEEKIALGYGKPCPCGEKGMMPGDKLCNCGEHCQECCDSGDCGCTDCSCKVT